MATVNLSGEEQDLQALDSNPNDLKIGSEEFEPGYWSKRDEKLAEALKSQRNDRRIADNKHFSDTGKCPADELCPTHLNQNLTTLILQGETDQTDDLENYPTTMDPGRPIAAPKLEPSARPSHPTEIELEMENKTLKLDLQPKIETENEIGLEK